MKNTPALNKGGDSAAYGMADMIPDKKLVGTFLSLFLETSLDG